MEKQIQTFDLAAYAGDFEGEYLNEIVHSINNHKICLAVFQGEYIWHFHSNSDEVFIVLEGELTIEFKDAPTLKLAPHKSVCIKKGIVHKTSAALRTVLLDFLADDADTIKIETNE